MKLPTGSIVLWYVPSRLQQKSSTLTDSHKGGKAGISAAPGKHAHQAGPADGCTVDRGGPTCEHVRDGMQRIIRSQSAADKQHDLPAVSHLCFAPLSV